MRRTVIIVEHPTWGDRPWITETGMMTQELGKLLEMIKNGRAGHLAHERHISESGTVITLFSDARTEIEEGIFYDSLVEVPYSQENASEMFLDKDGR